MSTREKVLTKISFMTDDQLEGLYAFLNSIFPDEVFNEETLAAFKEVEEMKKHPEDYKSYSSVDEMMGDILNEV